MRFSKKIICIYRLFNTFKTSTASVEVTNSEHGLFEKLLVPYRIEGNKI